VALICPSDNARQLVQAMGRIHRAGAKSKAINYLLYAENTIEEKIYKNVLSKIDNINAFNDGDLAEQNVFEVLNQQSKGEP
jgi:SNF2 family DNA or RNA helicase